MREHTRLIGGKELRGDMAAVNDEQVLLWEGRKMTCLDESSIAFFRSWGNRDSSGGNIPCFIPMLGKTIIRGARISGDVESPLGRW